MAVAIQIRGFFISFPLPLSSCIRPVLTDRLKDISRYIKYRFDIHINKAVALDIRVENLI